MNTSLNTEQFFSISSQYNASMFPAQFIFIFLGLWGIYLIKKERQNSTHWVGYLLAGLWVWMGVVYHFLFFTSLDQLAYSFGFLFILQGILFAFTTYKGLSEFNNGKTWRHDLAFGLIIFALIFYPAITYLSEGELTKMISIGLPCPTVIMTFGFLLLADKLPKYLLIIPMLWTVFDTDVAIEFGIYPNYVMPLAGLIVIYFHIFQRKKERKPSLLIIITKFVHLPFQ